MRYVVKISSDKWSNLTHQTQTIKTIKKKNIYSNQFFYTYKISNILKFFFIFQDIIYKIKIKKKSDFVVQSEADDNRIKNPPFFHSRLIFYILN